MAEGVAYIFISEGHSISLNLPFLVRPSVIGRQLPLRVDCLHFASKTFKMPKKSKLTVGSIPAVSTTE